MQDLVVGPTKIILQERRASALLSLCCNFSELIRYKDMNTKQQDMKISLSVIKDLYTNLHSFDVPMKELISKFLKDKVAIQSYVEDLKHDVEICGEDYDNTSYKKGIVELTALSLSL